MRGILFIFLCACLSTTLDAQKVVGKLTFDQSKIYTVTIQLKNTMAQQAMGQAIDFTVDGTAVHDYKVTNITVENTSLHHSVRRLNFNFDGMGQKRSFDSDKEKDLNGPFGKPVKEMLSKSYDVIIDSNGKTLLSKPESIELSKSDDRFNIISEMLRDLTGVVYSPKKGEASFFRVLPDTIIALGDSWTDSKITEMERATTVNTLSAINDTTLVIDYKTTATSLIKSQMMNVEATTNMNSIATGQILVDRVTGIIRQKTALIESTGNTEVMGSTMPVTAKTVFTIVVTPQ